MATDTLVPRGAGGGSTVPSPGRQIDPRIRARRIDVQRDVGRRRLWKLGALFGLVALVGAAAAALRSPLLDVDHIVVRGAARSGTPTVVTASGVRRRTPLAGVALQGASRRVAQLPWVATATVRRVWPGTVRITVTERTPRAQVRSAAGGWLLIDPSGRLLARRRHPHTALVTLAGSETASPGLWLAPTWQGPLGVVRALPAALERQVRTVGRDQRGIELRLVDGTTVLLGTPDQLTAKFTALATLLSQPDHRCFASIYLGVPTAPALTRRPDCA